MKNSYFMEKTYPKTRREQADRRQSVFKYYKNLCRENKDGNITKEAIYTQVAKKFDYKSVTSVKTVIRELKQIEDEKNKENIFIARGIVETVLAYEHIYGEIDAEKLDVRYNLEKAEAENTVFISFTFNADFNYLPNIIDGMVESREQVPVRADAFDHIDLNDIATSVGRLQKVFIESYEIFLNNTKNK